jgi:hypothetical protein
VCSAVRATYLEDVLLTLTLGVDDLAVVDHDSIATSAALLVGPADALGELGLRVGQEKLWREAVEISSVHQILGWHLGMLTMSSPVTSFALPQADMT